MTSGTAQQLYDELPLHAPPFMEPLQQRDAPKCGVCWDSGEVCNCGGPPCQVPAGYGCGLMPCPACGGVLI